MLYLSQQVGIPINNQQNERTGKIIDVLVQALPVGRSAPAYPSALLINFEEDDQNRRIPLDELQQSDGSWHLLHAATNFSIQPPVLSEDEASLAHEVLDKQVIDIEHKKAVRVNDVVFDNDWRILGIDKSSQSLIRRLAPSWLANALGQPTTNMLIPWEQIELIRTPRTENEKNEPPAPPSRALGKHLSALHPADIASIIHQLTPEQGVAILERLDDATAADTMEEIDTERQRQILENLPLERAATILQKMGPDEVADLLALLPEERAQELLYLMSPEDSEDVQELLEYAPDSAGGMMTTDYIVQTQTHTVREALEGVRGYIRDQDVRIAYVYCVENEALDECKPLGVISIWDLLIAQPDQRLQDLMETDIIKVQPDSSSRDVAEIMAKYNLLAVPVVNKEGILEGVVTVDDALDILLPKGQRRDSRHLY